MSSMSGGSVFNIHPLWFKKVRWCAWGVWFLWVKIRQRARILLWGYVCCNLLRACGSRKMRLNLDICCKYLFFSKWAYLPTRSEFVSIANGCCSWRCRYSSHLRFIGIRLEKHHNLTNRWTNWDTMSGNLMFRLWNKSEDATYTIGNSLSNNDERQVVQQQCWISIRKWKLKRLSTRSRRNSQT